MRLSKYRETAIKYTSKASEIVRQLTFAGIAIIWILRAPNKNGEGALSSLLAWALIFFVLALLLDLLQYIIGGMTWMKYYHQLESELMNRRKGESQSDLDPDVKAPGRLNSRIYFAYWSKIVAMMIGFLFLMKSLIGVILIM